MAMSLNIEMTLDEMVFAMGQGDPGAHAVLRILKYDYESTAFRDILILLSELGIGHELIVIASEVCNHDLNNLVRRIQAREPSLVAEINAVLETDGLPERARAVVSGNQG